MDGDMGFGGKWREPWEERKDALAGLRAAWIEEVTRAMEATEPEALWTPGRAGLSLPAPELEPEMPELEIELEW